MAEQGGKRDAAVAIVGIGCRFPGKANDVTSFWQLLVEGRDAITEIPPDRIDLERYYDPRPATPGRIMTRRGGFLDNIDQFDTAFFGMSPREAERLDPQHRLLLETAWEAIEDAGIDAHRLNGTRTAVYVGQWVSDFEGRLFANPEAVDFYMTTGSGRYASAGRLSYQLGLRGPSLTIDAACSSSLAAVHLAMRSLRSGECGVALAGGVNLILQPQITIAYSQSRMMAPDGRCKFGDARGDGYVRSEGAAMLVLKSLPRALADNDRIYAVIRGSAVNNDGSSSGMMGRPSRQGQIELLESALADAGVDAASIGLVEAHGTGTRAGDPVELGALAAVLGRQRRPGDKALVGSVKTNIGHTEGAAGVAGIIKVALSLHYGAIPASLHFEQPNPAIPWQDIPLQVPTALVPWPRGAVPRLAAVNAFGIGGTNAHAVLEEAPTAIAMWDAIAEPSSNPAAAVPHHVLLLSAEATEALVQRARDVGDFLARRQACGDYTVGDLCYTAALRRTHFEHRLAIIARDAAELRTHLAAFVAGDAASSAILGRATAPTALRRVIFVYPGQGPQWLGMARELLHSAPAFATALAECDRLIRSEAGWSVIDELEADAADSRLADIDVVQPVLFALQVALTQLWHEHGVEPVAVVGHSMGEVAAAWAAGALPLPDAVRVICCRSRLMRTARGQGAMALVELDLAAADLALARFGGRLCVAVSNSSRSTVIAGDPGVLDELLEELMRRDVFARRINVDVASHSPQMDPLLEPLREALAGIAPCAARLPFYSSVDAGIADGASLDADYWARNLRSTVRFSAVLQQLLAEGESIFIEMSPHPVLLPSIQQEAQAVGVDAPGIASLMRDTSGQVAFLAALARLHVAGRPIRWQATFGQHGVLVDLPSYPWQRERHWFEPPVADSAGASVKGAALLEQVVASSVESDAFFAEARLDLLRLPYLADHRVREAIVVPAALFIELACETAMRALGWQGASIIDLRLEEALLLEATGSRLVQVALSAGPPGTRTLRISSRALGDGPEAWTVHARGFLRDAVIPAAAPGSLPTTQPDSASATAHYAAMQMRGLEYGPSFRSISATMLKDGALWAKLTLPAGLPIADHLVHPTLLDGALQLGVVAAGIGGPDDTVVPVGCEEVHYVHGAPVASCWARALLRAPAAGADPARAIADVSLFRDDGSSLIELVGLALRRVGSARTKAGPVQYGIEWQLRADVAMATAGADAPSADAGLRWLIIAAAESSAQALADALDEPGRKIVVSIDATPLASTSGPRFDVVVHLFSDREGAGAAANADPLAPSLEACENLLSTIHAALGASAHGTPPQLVAVTTGAQAPRQDTAPVLWQAPLWGVMRTLANEHAELRSRVLDLPAAPMPADMAALAADLVRGGDDQVAIRDGQALLPRLRPVVPRATRAPSRAPRAGRAYCAVASTPGILDGLVCHPMDRCAPGRGEIEVEIEATGLNFMNVMSALGTYPGYADGVGPLGLECAGRVSAVGEGVEGLVVGERVMAIARDSLASHVLADARMVRARPASLTAAQAAATPIVFATAHYALLHLARLRRGERVLIHAAAGGVGLAAIQVARSVGAEIYATAGSPEKRALLAAQGVTHVFDSRSLAFREQLLACTAGEGVDVVLNSLAGEFVTASLAVLKPYGRFLEIGKLDIYRNTQVGLLPFRNSLAYFAIDLDRMIRDRPQLVGDLLDEVLARFDTGQYRPLPLATTPVSRMDEAFRDMAQGRHTGKLALTHDDPDLLLSDGDGLLRAMTAGTCVVTGGLGALGLAVAGWLADHGATRLALVGRSAVTPLQEAAIARLSARGLRVAAFHADVTDGAQVRSLFESIALQLGPVSGVVHAAGLLDDAMLSNQDAARFARVLAPKIGGAWQLHAALASHPGAVLVLFSSVVSLLGLAGQANYAAANAGLDALANFRHARGAPTLSINWGPWTDIGLAAARGDRGARLESRGLPGLPPAAALDALGRALEAGLAQVAIMNFDAPAYFETCPAAAHSTLLEALDVPPPVVVAVPAQIASLREQLQAAEPARRRAEVLQAFIREQVGKVLRQPASRLDLDKPFRSLGLDSLMGLELRNRLEAGTSLTLPATLIWNYPTISALCDELAGRLGVSLRDGAADIAAADPAAAGAARAAGGADADADLEAILAQIEGLSAEEARQQLAKGD